MQPCFVHKFRPWLFVLTLLALFAFAFIPNAAAVSVIEPPDLPNAAPGANYVLTAGTNTFSGTLTAPLDKQDYFDVTVPAGLFITQVSKTAANFFGFVRFNGETLSDSGTATFTGAGATPYPLPAGDYQALTNADFFSGSWVITIAVGPAADYVIFTGGGSISVNELSGNSDTLTLIEPAAGNIKFAAAGRTFSVNGGAPTTGDSSDLSLAAVSSITVNAGAGNSTINVGAFSGASFPSLVINGGSGDDVVNFNGDITFGAGKNLDADLQDDNSNPGIDSLNVAAGVNLIATGTGNFNLRCSRGIYFGNGASLESQNGGIAVSANQQTPPTPGNFIGVLIDGATLKSTGAGIGISGMGGTDSGGGQDGILATNGSQITAASGVSVLGMGGAGTGPMNRGVVLSGSTVSLNSSAGDVRITGTAGPQGSADGVGVAVLGGAQTTAGGNGTTTILGIGAGDANSTTNHGLQICGANSHIFSAGSITIFGLAGPGISFAIYLGESGVISKTGGFGWITMTTDSVFIDPTASITALSTTGIQITPSSPGTVIDLGGADARGNPSRLGLTNLELSRISGGGLTLGQKGNSSLVISAPIALPGIPSIALAPGDGGISAALGSADLSLGASGTCFLDSAFRCAIAGPVANTGYPQLKVEGKLILNNRPLVLTTTYTGVAGDSFVIVNNDDLDSITGTFFGLPEGAYLPWPGSSTLAARISYVGGNGNDVVVTLVDSADATTVTNTANSGPGSLREAIAGAAQFPGPNTIILPLELSGATIAVDGDISIMNNDLTIDATGLRDGLTLSGNNLNRIFYVSNSTVFLKGITFTNGNGSGTNRNTFGGAIANDFGGSLTLIRCTFFNNSAHHDGGAIYNDNSGILSLTDCTLASNSALHGGAIYIDAGTATLTHCTLSGNSATDDGGAIDNSGGTLTLANSVVAGNNSPLTHADIFQESGTIADSGANLIGSNFGLQGTFPMGPLAGTLGSPLDPLLAPLGNYGGGTQTMALLQNSPARDASVSSTATSDQRAFPIVGAPDLGAYEAGAPADFHTWAIETNGADLLFDSDADGDGAGAGLEYALRREPGTADTGLVPMLSGATGAHFYSFRYRATARDLRYVVQRSDLDTPGNWMEIYRYDVGTSQITKIGVTSDENPTTETVTLTDPVLGDHFFWRLRIEIVP